MNIWLIPLFSGKICLLKFLLCSTMLLSCMQRLFREACYLLIVSCYIAFTTACFGVVIEYSWMADKYNSKYSSTRLLKFSYFIAGCSPAPLVLPCCRSDIRKTDPVSHVGDCVVAVPGRCCKIFRSAHRGLMCLQTRRKTSMMPSNADVGRAALNSSCVIGQMLWSPTCCDITSSCSEWLAHSVAHSSACCTQTFWTKTSS